VLGVGGVSWVALAGDETIRTADGQQKTQSLSDGSLIAVNVASQVSYDIGRERRHVKLASGEAAFKVEPDASRPFAVRTDDYEIRATGTAFNVRLREGVLEVAVGEGSVQICSLKGARSQEILASLSAGQTIRLPAEYPASGIADFSKGSITPEQVSEWRMRVVSYQSARVRDVIADFNRYFEDKLIVEDEALLERKVTIRVQVEDRERAIALLADLLGVRVRHTERGDMLLP
jgi:transmembrane sensor